jgi:hypothetical protein
MTRTLPRALQQDINIVRTTNIMAHGDYTGMASGSSILPFVPGPACRGSEPLFMPPLNYKRGGMQRYNTSSIFMLRPKSSKTAQAPKQYNTQWSRVLRSGGPNHSKRLCVLVFVPSSRNKQNA